MAFTINRLFSKLCWPSNPHRIQTHAPTSGKAQVQMLSTIEWPTLRSFAGMMHNRR